MPTESTGLPLEGVRVIEFTHMVMGPTCGMILADLGAEVVHVVRYNLGLIEKATMARLGIGRRSLSPRSSESAAKQVVKHLVLILSWL